MFRNIKNATEILHYINNIHRWEGRGKELQTESYEHQKEIHVIFIDFKQTYDRIKRNELYRALWDLGIQGKMINMVQVTLKYTEDAVKVGGNVSESFQGFQVKDGLRQWDQLFIILNLALETAIRNTNINRSGLLYYKRYQYANDIAIISRELGEIVKRLERSTQKLGLRVNKQKMKDMNWSDKQSEVGKKFALKTEERKSYIFEDVERF